MAYQLQFDELFSDDSLKFPHSGTQIVSFEP